MGVLDYFLEMPSSAMYAPSCLDSSTFTRLHTSEFCHSEFFGQCRCVSSCPLSFSKTVSTSLESYMFPSTRIIRLDRLPLITRRPNMSTQGIQEQALDLVTAATIQKFKIKDAFKALYLHRLRGIESTLDITKPFGQEDWSALAQWQELSKDFYALVGVEGKVIVPWSNESQATELGTTMKALHIRDNNDEESIN